MQKIIAVSLTAEMVKNLMVLNIALAISPKAIPIPRDPSASTRNCPMIVNGVVAVKPSFPSTNWMTALNKMMETASFEMPSPKMREKSLGCSSYLMIDIAAMTSEEQMSALKSKHSIDVIWKSKLSFVRKSYL
jgi:hypothetical protein